MSDFKVWPYPTEITAEEFYNFVQKNLSQFVTKSELKSIEKEGRTKFVSLYCDKELYAWGDAKKFEKNNGIRTEHVRVWVLSYAHGDLFWKMKEFNLQERIPHEARHVTKEEIIFPKIQNVMIPVIEPFIVVPQYAKLSKNKNGHCVFTITGRDFTGEEEISQLLPKGFTLSGGARQALLSSEYDRKHRLENGKIYSVVLIHVKEIQNDSWTNDIIKAYANKFGYIAPQAGLAPRIRESVSVEQLIKMNAWYLVSLHDPIYISNGCLSVLQSFRSSLMMTSDNPYHGWPSGGVFAFIDP